MVERPAFLQLATYCYWPFVSSAFEQRPSRAGNPPPNP